MRSRRRRPCSQSVATVVAELARDVVRLEVEESTEGLRTLRGQFLAAGPGATGPRSQLLHLDGGDLDFGKALEVALGPPGTSGSSSRASSRRSRRGSRTAQPPSVTAYAEDALMRLRMTRRMRTYQRRQRRRHRRRGRRRARPARRRRRRRADATTSSSSSTRATSRSCASGPGWSRPSSGATAHPALPRPAPTARHRRSRSCRATSC